jgi:hypothetical protein
MVAIAKARRVLERHPAMITPEILSSYMACILVSEEYLALLRATRDESRYHNPARARACDAAIEATSALVRQARRDLHDAMDRAR